MREFYRMIAASDNRTTRWRDLPTGPFASRLHNSLKFENLEVHFCTGEASVMTKADLIDEVSRVVELTRKDSEVIVETIFGSIVRSLHTGDKIEIRGFGSFRTRQRKPRIGRNPKTGDRVEVPAKKIPFFKPSKELKDLVNNSPAEPAAATAGSSIPPQSAPAQ
jgi:integration host factor subunit beta